MSIVEPGTQRWSFQEFFVMTFVEDELMRGRANAGTNFDLSTSQIERGTRRELTLGGTELFA